MKIELTDKQAHILIGALHSLTFTILSMPEIRAAEDVEKILLDALMGE